jgi:hypothetical protein
MSRSKMGNEKARYKAVFGNLYNLNCKIVLLFFLPYKVVVKPAFFYDKIVSAPA